MEIAAKRGPVPFWRQKGTEKPSGGLKLTLSQLNLVRGKSHGVCDSP
jgi:hypothetical protein